MAIGTSTIRQILQRIAEGEIRIPAFQREFVWEPDRVQFLMDSIYKQYPIGTVLFWRTRERLEFDRDLGPYKLPQPKEQYPIDYVLDGQQRLTSIFSVFQTDLAKNSESKINWVDIYFDLSANEDAQDSQFLALVESDVQSFHVPLKILFDVTEYGKFTRGITDTDMLNKVDLLQTRFKEAQIPVESVETEEHSKIAIIFERVNRGGVPLDTFQLLAAWTWSGDFDLRAKFEELSNELDEVGYSDLRDDPDLLLKCCATVIKDNSSAHSVIELKGEEVRDSFEKFKNGILGAIEFLKRDCGVCSLKVLPYKSMIIPLARFFCTEKNSGFHPSSIQRETLVRWFWHSLFARRYSNSVDTALTQDINGVIQLLNNDTTIFDKRSISVSPEFFTKNIFSLNAVNTKTFVLLLANQNPKSFISGATVDLDVVLMSCNRTEFHHIFPKNHLKTKCGVENRDEQFMLANFAFLSQSDNRAIQDKAPENYKNLIPIAKYNEIMDSSIIPHDGLAIEYQAFIKARSLMLAIKANELSNKKT